MKRLSILFLLNLCLAAIISAQTTVSDSVQVAAPDSTDVKELNEVSITAETYIHKGEYDLLLLSKENREFGTNALDAISSMSMFLTSLNSTNLSLWDHSEVFILIDGVPATGTDLKTYSSEEIKNVKFYAVAPPRYLGYTSGAVIDVILKKRHDRLYSGSFDTRNGINHIDGYNFASLAYRDSLNQVRVYYGGNYRNTDGIKVNSFYEYSPNVFSQYSQQKKYKWTGHSVSTSYQYYNGNHLFNAAVGYRYDKDSETLSGTRTLNRDAESFLTSSDTRNKTLANTLSLSLYYNYMLNNGGLFAINVVNTFGKSNSESFLKSSQYDNGAADFVDTYADNKSYSMIASSYFVSTALGGQYSFASRYEYKQLRQHYLENLYKPYSHSEFFNASIRWDKNNFAFSPTIGISVLNQVDAANSYTSVLPYVRLYSGWWPQGKLKGLALQLTLIKLDEAPSLSMLTSTPSYKDFYFYSKGNPELKNTSNYFANFAATYVVPDSRNMIAFKARVDYYDKPIASTIDNSGEMPVLMPKNINYSLDNFFLLYASWYPFSWLELAPYVELESFKNSTPTHKTNICFMRYGGGITFHYKDWELSLAANSPTKRFDGDLYRYGSPQYAVIAQYKYRNWSFGARYNYSGHNDMTRSNSPVFKYQTVADWKTSRETVCLTATYSFSIGRSRQHSSPVLYESSNDNGLNRYNSPHSSN